MVARTGDASVKKSKESLDRILGFLQTFLLVFAGIALIVGIFLIINTFSILVAQRSRELALLRAMGASRRQVNGAVLLEALIVGLVGSTVGPGPRATCSRSDCAGCSASSGSTSAARRSR